MPPLSIAATIPDEPLLYESLKSMLSVRELHFERHYMPVFAPLSFSLAAGELLLVTGANGAGKTTLLRLLSGALEPTGGQITRPPLPVVFIGHSLGLKQALTVTENLQFMQGFCAAHTRTADSLLHQLGLEAVADQAVSTLSAGQRKRCALARLLLQPNALWLLDEPYANLDRAGVELVNRILESHQRRQGIAVVASHGQLLPENLHYRELEVTPGAIDD